MKIAPFILSLLLLSPGQGKSPGVHVLCYHGFQTDKNRFSFLLTELKSQLDFFRKRGFRFVTFSDIDSGNFSGNRNILITVDDGNRSVYDAYYHVFRPMKIKPVLAIYPAVTGREKYALTWKQLRRLSDDGCEVAAHGYSHRYLNSRLYRKERRAFEREISTSRKLLERKLGRSVDIFVYPYGVKSPEAVKALKKAGYRYAFTINSGTMFLKSARGDSVYDLPRYMITRGTRRLILDRIARKTGSEKQVLALNNHGEKPVPDMKSLIIKPKKVPEPLDEKTGPVVVYRDRYRDYGRKKESSLIKLGLKDSLVEIDEKPGVSPDNGYTSYRDGKSGRETELVAGFGIVDIPGTRGIYVHTGTGVKTFRDYGDTKKEGSCPVLTKLKSSYKKTAISAYRYYSLWIDRLRARMHAVKRKIEKLINDVFT